MWTLYLTRDKPTIIATLLSEQLEEKLIKKQITKLPLIVSGSAQTLKINKKPAAFVQAKDTLLMVIGWEQAGFWNW